MRNANKIVFLILFIFCVNSCTKNQPKNNVAEKPVEYETPLVGNISNRVDDIDVNEIVFIHTGDFHGDLEPHPNARADSNGLLEGGLARVFSVVQNIRSNHEHTIHVHTGDTIAGSAEATFTLGDALVRVVDHMDVDVFVPGNWEFSYGIYRFLQFFGSGDDIVPYTEEQQDQADIVIPANEQGFIATHGLPFKSESRWGAISANAYFNGLRVDPGVNKRSAGELLMKPYRVMEVNGVRFGFIGCTTNRGPQIVSSNITTGISFTNCKGEVKFPQNKPIDWSSENANAANQGVEENPEIDTRAGGDKGHVTVSEIDKFIAVLRAPKDSIVAEYPKWLGEGVDIVILLSEGGLAESIYNAEHTNDLDIIFSSDMHEETKVPVVVTAPDGGKTIIVEEGEDGSQVGELAITVNLGKISTWRWIAHDIDTRIPENPKIAALVAEIRAPFYQDFVPGRFTNPYNGARLMEPLNTVMGETDVTIERNRFSNELTNYVTKVAPAVIEGTGHALITDAFRVLTNAKVGGIRGFRYANTILADTNITTGDMYHYMPIGAMIAKADIPSAPESEVFSDGSALGKKDWIENKRHFMAWPRNLIQEIELSGNSTMNPNVAQWGGGWVFNYSGIHFDFEPYNTNFDKYGSALNARVSNVSYLDGTPMPLVLDSMVSFASYYFHADYNRINRNQIRTQGQCGGTLSLQCVGDLIQILAKDAESSMANLIFVNPQEYEAGLQVQKIFPLDAVEALKLYISKFNISVFDWDPVLLEKSDLVHIAQGLGGEIEFDTFDYPRINVTTPLVDATLEFGFPVIEPLRGAPSVPGDHVADPPANQGVF